MIILLVLLLILLAHVTYQTTNMNYSYIKKVVGIELIHKISLENYGKYESCVESKNTMQTCKLVKWQRKLFKSYS